MARADVTIIMPTYNRAYMIKKAIDSVEAQTHKNWELIIVDDGSTDNTRGLIKSLNNPKVHYKFKKNGGPAAARNYGLGFVKTKWVAYLDSDNELLPHYIETMFRWLSKNPKAVFSFPRAHRTLELYENEKLIKLIDTSDKDTPHEVTAKDIFMHNFNPDTNGFMHLKKLFDEGIGWDENLHHGMEDWDLAMSIGEKYPKGFLYVKEVLYNYHQRYGGDGVVSNSEYADYAKTFEYIYQKHKKDRMLAGQTWYPRKVEKWNRLQKEFEEGKQPPYHLFYFQ